MKPVVLVFIGYYLPAFRAGGPVRTIANIVERLGDEFEFLIVTRDRDIGDRGAFEGIHADVWCKVGNAQVMYVDPHGLTLRKVASLIRTTPHDLIYLNSFFDPEFTQMVLINRYLRRIPSRPIVLAPRGELSLGALGLKQFKKRVYIRLARLLGLYAGLIWQGSSERELADIARVFPRAKTYQTGHLVVAPDVTDSVLVEAPSKKGRRDSDGRLRLCFLSRISPIKNLEYALSILARVKVPVVFAIYGPIEDPAYWRACETKIKSLPGHIEVSYEGRVRPQDVISTLAKHDVFFLPTRGENFGHVIHEALRAGLAILISDQTPWLGLEQRDVGWDIPLADEDQFVQRIEQASGWSVGVRNALSIRARALAAQISNDVDVLNANRNLFSDAIGRYPSRE